MLGIILIAISIGTVSVVMPVAEFSIPLDAYNSQSNGATGSTGQVGGDGVGVSGWVHIEVYDSEGNTKYVNDNHNLVVTKGLQSISDLVFGTTHTTGESVGGFSHIQLGTGTTNPAIGDTDCETIAGHKIDDTAPTNTALGVYLNATINQGDGLGDGISISEICLTDSNTNATGNLFARQEFTPFTFNAGDTVNATWTITFADSDGT